MRGLLTILCFGLILSLSPALRAQEKKAEKAKPAKKSDDKKQPEKKKAESGKKKAEAKKAEAKKAEAKKAEAKKAEAKKAEAKKAEAKKEAKKPSSVSSAVPQLSNRLKEIFAGTVPKNIADLKAMESHVQKLTNKVTPSTVGIFNGAAGSGVIVSPDGYVLTAAHVAMQPGRTVQIVLHDGRAVRGKTLGMNKRVDAGLIKIETKGVWPYAEMGTSANLKQGQWCVALGHPGGFQRNRRAPVRFGRIISAGQSALRTDCTLVGGDSGGPLFDLNGRVIGIHSRISRSIQSNVHVPVAHYTSDWDTMAKSEIIERTRPPSGPAAAYLGITFSTDEDKANLVVKVTPKSSAEKYGIKVNDRIVKFNGRSIRRSRDLRRQLALRTAGDKVEIEVDRGGKIIKIKVELGKRDD